jgi:hypothetical protein
LSVSVTFTSKILHHEEHQTKTNILQAFPSSFHKYFPHATHNQHLQMHPTASTNQLLQMNSTTSTNQLALPLPLYPPHPFMKDPKCSIRLSPTTACFAFVASRCGSDTTVTVPAVEPVLLDDEVEREMRLDCSTPVGERRSLYTQCRVGKNNRKGQPSNFGETEMENNGNTGYKTKKSRPTVSTRKSFSNTSSCGMFPFLESFFAISSRLNTAR